MYMARSIFARHREQIPSAAVPVSTASSGRPPGYHQWLHMWRAERQRWSHQRPDYQWDPQHERVLIQTADSHLDFILQQSGPALRLALYDYLALP